MDGASEPVSHDLALARCKLVLLATYGNQLAIGPGNSEPKGTTMIVARMPIALPSRARE